MKCVRQRGQAVLELAIIFPFFLLIIVGGIIDFGFALNNLITLQQISNDVALYAAEGDAGQPVNEFCRVNYYAQAKKPSWWTNEMKVTVTSKTTSDAGQKPLKEVVIEYTSPMYTPLYNTLLNVVSGSSGLKLSTLAAFQVPTQ